MNANVKVQEHINKKTGQIKQWVLIPSRVREKLEIKKGNLLDVEIENPNPEYVDPIKVGNNFKKDESPKPEQPESI